MLEIAFVLVSAMGINIVIITTIIKILIFILYVVSFIILKFNIDRPTSISSLIILNVFNFQ